MDEEKKGFTTLEVINNLNTTQLKDLVELIHPNDISNTDVLEYGHIDGEEIRQVIFVPFYIFRRLHDLWGVLISKEVSSDAIVEINDQLRVQIV